MMEGALESLSIATSETAILKIKYYWVAPF